jgi:hypothetical protein
MAPNMPIHWDCAKSCPARRTILNVRQMSFGEHMPRLIAYGLITSIPTSELKSLEQSISFTERNRLYGSRSGQPPPCH